MALACEQGPVAICINEDLDSDHFKRVDYQAKRIKYRRRLRSVAIPSIPPPTETGWWPVSDSSHSHGS